jgi:hypothetical protein
MTAGLREYIDAIASTGRLKKSALTVLMQSHARYLPKDVVLEMCIRLAAKVPGSIVEFGLANGDSARVLRRHSKKEIFALDSFEGLQERFETLQEKFETLNVGHFAEPVPDIPGVNFVKGYFENTCTDQLAAQVGRVAFAHLDTDLYSSTLAALRWLTPLLVDGSLILFDELTGGDRAEARALAAWQTETGIVLTRIAEFDREPSGGGDIPDKRLLVQIIVENSANTQRFHWVANTKTFLKATTAMSATLSDTQKHPIRIGDVITGIRRERHGAHAKIFEVYLNGEPLHESDWFILESHWDML